MDLKKIEELRINALNLMYENILQENSIKIVCDCSCNGRYVGDVHYGSNCGTYECNLRCRNACSNGYCSCTYNYRYSGNSAITCYR